MICAAGHQHSLVVGAGGTVLAWGSNSHGQVGTGDIADQHKPVTVIEGGIHSVAAGHYHSLAVTKSGEVWAWGKNEDGLLGVGTTVKQLTPAKVANLPVEIDSVAAGAAHCLALCTSTGEVFAWGCNSHGQLGNGTQKSCKSPVRALEGRCRAIAAGAHHSLAVLDTGEVLTWGLNISGSGVTACIPITTPTMVPLTRVGGVSDVRATSVAAGAVHSLAVTEAGDVLSWGGNNSGQLGDGSLQRRLWPEKVAGNSLQVAAGGNQSALRAYTNDVYIWGSMVEIHKALVPKGPAMGLPQAGCVQDIFEEDMSVWRRELIPSRAGFVRQEGSATSSIFSIALGGAHMIAIDFQGAVHAMGSNAAGQLGDGTTSDRPRPVPILPDRAVEMYDHTKEMQDMLDSLAKVRAIGDSTESMSVGLQKLGGAHSASAPTLPSLTPAAAANSAAPPAAPPKLLRGVAPLKSPGKPAYCKKCKSKLAAKILGTTCKWSCASCGRRGLKGADPCWACPGQAGCDWKICAMCFSGPTLKVSRATPVA